MANIKKMRKRDVLIFVVAIAAVALVVFGTTMAVEHFSKRTSRDSRPIDPDATTSTPETEPEVTTPDTEPEPLAVTTTPTTTTEAETTEATTTSESEAPEPTTVPTTTTEATTTTTVKAEALTMPEDTGKPEAAKTEEEILEELEELADSYAANGYNNNIKNIVLIGVDRDELGEHDYFRTGGQSDTVMVLSFNLKTKEYWFVSVNRDLALPIENYSAIGESYGFVEEQLALANAYGDGSRLSGKNVVKALDFLFGDQLPFLGFVAAPMSMVGTLADAVDGVPVEIKEDMTITDPSFINGTTVILRGKKAEKYVRARMKLNQKNVQRMSRQFEFCESFINKAKTTKSASQLVNLYDDLMDLTMTDMGKSDITKWILTAYDYELKGFYRIDGVRHEDDLKHRAPYNDVVQSEVDDILDMYFK